MKPIITIALLLVINLISCTNPSSNRIYTSTNTELQTALNQANPGDTIIVKNGDYHNMLLEMNRSGNKDKRITIKAETAGKSFFTGETGIRIKGDYITFSGFSFEGAMIHSEFVDLKEKYKEINFRKYEHPPLIESEGSYNTFEDLYINKVSNNPKLDHHTYFLLHDSTQYNIINRCWLERKTQRGMGVLIHATKDFHEGRYHVVTNCYFKADRQDGNGGSAVRIGTGMETTEGIAKCTVKNCFFDEYDGEEEIFSIKSTGTTLDSNTFLNCRGMLSFRHSHNNVLSNCFIINNDESPIEGGFFCIWGKGHKIVNNYFYGSKRNKRTTGTISMISGNSDKITTTHEAVADILIKDNIIYESDTSGYAITVGARHKYRSENRSILPRDVTIAGNYIYNSSEKEQIKYTESPKNIKYSDNKVFGNIGLSPVPEGIVKTDIKLVADKYGIYRAKGKGPAGNPLSKKDVGPKWLQ
ncbi:MAG: polysaccharide lyase 6 family protein [Labilibaculum sp.]|nr:polysaccharide lyase 6 family protein [Labilibaculum sp.]MBI9057359.1 polysaccharide lyase 6 family protein [Labilibaculum sp.]